jgi:cytochrome c553
VRCWTISVNRHSATALICAALFSAAAAPAAPAAPAASPPREPAPSWAFAVNPSPVNAPPALLPASAPDDTLQHVAGSDAAFTRQQIDDLFTAVDWHPEDHPPMPPVGAHGRPPELYACGYCHLPNGQGRPENASLAGLPVSYIVEQMAEFRAGRRRSSEPRHLPASLMAERESRASARDTLAAARYFSALKPKPWIRLIETAMVEPMHIAGWMLVSSGVVDREAIGERIIETPENLEQTELRDDRSGFVAFVPAGSVDAGRELVENGGGRTMPCAACHGGHLKGLGAVASLAGRSPSYLVRQLYDLKSGARGGRAAQPMLPVVANLTVADMGAIAAYVASLPP